MKNTNSPKVNLSRPIYSKAFPRRFKEICERSGWKLKQLAAEVGVSFQTIQRWQTGERKPERIAAQKLAEVLQSNIGEPWLTEFAKKGTLLTEIPVVAYVAGGRPIVEDIEDEFIKVDPRLIPRIKDACGLRVKGESMVEEHILNGDTLLCRRAPDHKQIAKGTIVVVDLKGERGAAVKRFEFKNEMIYLYASRYAKDEDKQSFHDWEVGKIFELVGLVRTTFK